MSPSLQNAPARRDAVNHLLVDRRANRRRIPVIALERRRRPCLARSASRPARRDRRCSRPAPPRGQLRQHLADQPPGRPHRLELGRRPADNHGPLLRPSTRRPRPPPSSPPPPLRRLRAVDRAECRPRPVVVHERLCSAGRPSGVRGPPPRYRRPAALNRRRISGSARSAATSPAGVHLARIAQHHAARRPRRRTSSASGTAMSTTISGFPAVHEAVERLACATVRGKPSRMNPGARRSFPGAPCTIPIITSSLDQLAAVHDRLGPQPDLGAGFHRLAQHVAGRDLGNAVGSRTVPPACPCPPRAGPA